MSDLAFGARVLLGLIFLLAGSGKLRDLDAFEEGIREYDLLPRASLRPIAVALAVIETTIGILLLTGQAMQPAAIASLALLVGFAVAGAVSLLHGRHHACHCGLDGGESLGWATLVRQGFLALAAWTILVGGAIMPPLQAAIPLVLSVVPLLIGLRVLSALPELWSLVSAPLPNARSPR